MPIRLDRQLGQVRPVDSTPISIFQPRQYRSGLAGAEIISVVIVNTSASTANFSMFLDDDGTVYDESTALFWEVPVGASSTIPIDVNLKMNNSEGNLAVKSSAGNALTFTIFGSELI